MRRMPGGIDWLERPMVTQTIAIHVVPNAPRTVVGERRGDALKIKLHAPAIEGRANEELLRVVAETREVSRAAVCLVRGGKSREKIVAVDDCPGDAAAGLMATA